MPADIQPMQLGGMVAEGTARGICAGLRTDRADAEKALL